MPQLTSIDDLLERLVEQGASDLHVAVGSAPAIRINGTLVGAAIGMLLFLVGAAIPTLHAALAGWHFW